MIAALSASCAAGQAPLPASEHVAQPEVVALTGAAPSTAGELAPEAVQPAVVDGQSSAVAEPVRQIRAVWVDAFHDGVKSLAQVDRLIADCRLGGINTIIVQVRRRGDAYYSRTAEPRTEDPAFTPGFDALQATINAARAAWPPLEVHAWLATIPIWNRKDRPPASPAHVFNRHGPEAADGENWLSLSDTGESWDGDNYMLDPGHPAAAAYVASVAEEVARYYDVDGIHLDLIRYAGVQWGHNPVSVARYNQQRGTSGVPRRDDQRWHQWRRDQVTALVRRIYLDCLAVRPRIKVTAATIGWGSGPTDDRTWRATSAYGNVFQDWVAWLRDGLVDVVMPMNYDNERMPAQKLWFDQWVNWQREHRGQRHVAAGIGLFLNEARHGLDQIRRALEPAPSGACLEGVALYSYAVTNSPPPGSETPTTPNDRFLRALTTEGDLAAEAGPLFRQPAIPPPMPWKDNPGAHVRGRVVKGDLAVEGIPVQFIGPARGTAAVDGNGYWGATDLPPGVYSFLLDARGAAGITHAPASAYLAPGQVADVTINVD